jgi:hypothetical protein
VLIHFQGRNYTWDEEKITLNQAYVIKANTGHTIRAWLEAIQELDPHAIAHMWWIILAQNGETRNVADLGEVPFIALMAAIGESAEAEEKAQQTAAAAGPTPPAPASPAAAAPGPIPA